ncbi:MAG: glycosyltransferase [Defluviitaleaceae bacterium]|nr:glycosyltransferase [Defluviitaleaceae bacterium]
MNDLTLGLPIVGDVKAISPVLRKKTISIVERNPKISIITTVYNMEEYIDESILSLRNQQLENPYDIEIITVDDCSTDGTLARLREHSLLDDRVRIIAFDENKSVNQARKAAVMAANGTYIMFVDGDDTLDRKACGSLILEMEKYNVDILHFCMKFISAYDNEENRLKVEKFNNKKDLSDILLIDNTDDFTILKYRYSSDEAITGFLGTLTANLFNSDIVKKAYEHILDVPIHRASDTYAQFLIMYYAKSYKKLLRASYTYYFYYYGRGGYGKSSYDFKWFKMLCTKGIIITALKAFLIKFEQFENLQNIFYTLENNMIMPVFNEYNKINNENEKKLYFNCMTKYFEKQLIIEKLAYTKFNNAYNITEALKNTDMLGVKKAKRIKVIGAYYTSISGGGAQKVTCMLCDLWVSMGYNVVLFTDSEPNIDDFPLSDFVKRVFLPDSTHKAKKYPIRMKALLYAITLYKIDVFVYHRWLSPILFWDVISIKSLNIPVILYTHGIFSNNYLNASETFFLLSKIVSYIDCLVVLSRVCYAYWSAFCKNIKIVENPHLFDINNIIHSKLTTNNILWIGRVSHEKLPEQALQIINIVSKKIPSVKMYLVGTKNNNDPYIQKLMKYVKENYLTNNVFFIDFTNNVKNYYQNSDIMLLTTKSEGWSLSIMEATMYGLPIICYDMPYLEMIRRHKGSIITVPQNDVNAAAEAIVDLLVNRNKLTEMGKKSLFLTKQLLNYDIKSTWKNIFDSVTEGKTNKPQYIPTNDDYKIMIQTLDHHSEGIYKKIIEHREYKNELNKLKNSL